MALMSGYCSTTTISRPRALDSSPSALPWASTPVAETAFERASITPWSVDFSETPVGAVPPHWIGAKVKYVVQEKDGEQVLCKLHRPRGLLRNALYMGPSTLSNYTIEGDLMGVQANVGGVGIAMLLLIYLSNLSSEKWRLTPITEKGVNFWSAMYIPIVVAMAAKQNVLAAISNGWMAITAGVAAVAVSFAMIPLLARFGAGGKNDS